MGILESFEDSVSRVIEGTFNGIFRSHVQPAEIARACIKEMDRSKKLGVGKVYVANLYTIVLSPRDYDALAGLMPTLEAELETLLLAHGRENNYQLAARPAIEFASDKNLKLGKFETIGEVMSQSELSSAAGTAPAAASDSAPEPAADTPLGIATITGETIGEVKLTTKDGYSIGRKEDCDIQIVDSAVSRYHAKLERDGTGWAIIDNEATNPTKVDGRPIKRQRLTDGDVITVGTTELTYRQNYAASTP